MIESNKKCIFMDYFVGYSRPSLLTLKQTGNPAKQVANLNWLGTLPATVLVNITKLATLPATVLVNINKDVKHSNEANCKYVCIQSLFNIALLFKLL